MHMFVGLHIFVLILMAAPAQVPAPVPTPQRSRSASTHYYGEVRGTGVPSIVLESGMGETSATWAGVADRLAEKFTVFSYDRRGLGKSPASKSRRDARQLARELHSALKESKIAPPYVLVGHPLGGLVVMLFADLYPKEVAGIVLEDVAWNERELQRRLGPDVWHKRESTIARFSQAIPLGVRREKAALQLSIDQAASAKLPNVPATIMTGTKTSAGFPGADEEKALKLEEHESLKGRLPASRHVVVPSSRHYIHVDEPTLFTQAIVDLAAQVGARP